MPTLLDKLTAVRILREIHKLTEDQILDLAIDHRLLHAAEALKNYSKSKENITKIDAMKLINKLKKELC